MAAEIQTGTAVIYGVSNTGSAITVTGYATFLWDTIRGTHQFKIEDLQDYQGADVTAIATNEHFEVDIDFKPSGATRAAAAAVAVFLTPLSKVTLANFKVSAFNGDHQYRGDTVIELSNVNPAKLSGMKLRRYADSTQNTALTTTVSG